MKIQRRHPEWINEQEEPVPEAPGRETDPFGSEGFSSVIELLDKSIVMGEECIADYQNGLNRLKKARASFVAALKSNKAEEIEKAAAFLEDAGPYVIEADQGMTGAIARTSRACDRASVVVETWRRNRALMMATGR